MGVVCSSRCRTRAWSTYHSSGFFGRSGSVLPAFLASLPAPGRRTEERGGSGASARATEDQREPSPGAAGGFWCFERWTGEGPPGEESTATEHHQTEQPPGRA